MAEHYLGNMVFDITGSLKDYNFTNRSVIRFNQVISSKQFENMPSDTIFSFLQNQMEIVSFGDYLKRYLYEKTGITMPYSQVSEEYYVSVIKESFSLNRAPHAFWPVNTKFSNTVHRWLRCQSVRRSTIFLLGFGLRMSEQEVSVFLTKVIKEPDFQLEDPIEAIFWHCYRHELPYAQADGLIASLKELGCVPPSAADAAYWRAAGVVT